MNERRSRGTYAYRVDGRDAEVEEHWERIERGGEHHVRSVRTVPAADTLLTVESLCRDGAWVSCDLDWRRASGPDGDRVTATYRFDDDGITMRWRGPAGGTEVLQADAESIFSPLMRVHGGDVIHRLAERTGGRVLVPWIGDATDPERLFRPDYSERWACVLGEDQTDVDGTPRPCLRYEYGGGPYVPSAECWVDESGMLLRYRWRPADGKAWDVRLRGWQA